jgi:hypothetical protein
MAIKQGDIFWIDLGAPKGSEPGYRHPYIVIQNNVFNMSLINTVERIGSLSPSRVRQIIEGIRLLTEPREI